MDDLTQQYLGMIQDANQCLKHYTSHILELESTIKDLRAELKEKEDKLMLFMTKDSLSPSRHDLRTFFITVKNRKETDAEWELFQTTFRFRLHTQIYEWIDSLS